MPGCPHPWLGVWRCEARVRAGQVRARARLKVRRCGSRRSPVPCCCCRGAGPRLLMAGWRPTTEEEESSCSRVAESQTSSPHCRNTAARSGATSR